MRKNSFLKMTLEQVQEKSNNIKNLRQFFQEMVAESDATMEVVHEHFEKFHKGTGVNYVTLWRFANRPNLAQHAATIRQIQHFVVSTKADYEAVEERSLLEALESVALPPSDEYLLLERLHSGVLIFTIDEGMVVTSCEQRGGFLGMRIYDILGVGKSSALPLAFEQAMSTGEEVEPFDENVMIGVKRKKYRFAIRPLRHIVTNEVIGCSCTAMSLN